MPEELRLFRVTDATKRSTDFMSLYDHMDSRERFIDRDERQLDSERRRERMERVHEVSDQELSDQEAAKCDADRSSS